VGIGVELVGKDYFSQAVPNFLQRGMNSLGCPQIASQPGSVKLTVMLGMWWQAPAIPPKRLQRAQHAATASLNSSGAYDDYGYPSGHAIRWIFIGLVACWLFWRQVKHRILRWLLMALALAIALGGGLAQVYMGFHLTTDLTAGYLFGVSTACCAIGLLLLNETKNRYTL
jgi:membrane-associated phospholipid phosphatase